MTKRKRSISYTHKGWFGFCPVYFADPDGKEKWAGVEARSPWFEWLFDLSEGVFGVLFFILGFFRADIELSWPFLVTGELPAPITREIEEDEE